MKKAIMKVGSFVLCYILLFCACSSVALTASAVKNSNESAPKSAQEAADALHELGLFNGTGTDLRGYPIYELNRAPNRHESVTMLVRLLGKEAIAEETPWSAPFTDVADWAKPYVGYAYGNGITLGTSSTTFGGKANTTVAANGKALDSNCIVSMNMWGFTPDIIDTIQERFPLFLRDNIQNLTAEYLLPVLIDQLLQEGTVSVRQLPTQDKWYGITYREDIPHIREALRKIVES